MKIVKNYFIIIFFSTILISCTSSNPKIDPFESYNKQVFRFNNHIDRVILKPVAKIYKNITPKPINFWLTNMFANISDLYVLINDLLQGQMLQTRNMGARIILNSTLGVAGMVDVAQAVELRDHKNDFGVTLGKWGVKNSPYFMLPVLGPSTIRDTLGLLTSIFLYNPYSYINDIKARNAIYAVNFIDQRADLLGTKQIVAATGIDEYNFIRDGFFQQRNALILGYNQPDNQVISSEDDKDFDADLDLFEQELSGKTKDNTSNKVNKN